MPKSKIILALGACIALLPLLGFPHSWESVFQIVLGLSIVLLSVLISIDRRLSLKARVQKRQARKRAVVETNPEIHYGRRAGDIEAEQNKVRFGRRASDVAIRVPETSRIPEIPELEDDEETEATF